MYNDTNLTGEQLDSDHALRYALDAAFVACGDWLEDNMDEDGRDLRDANDVLGIEHYLAKMLDELFHHLR